MNTSNLPGNETAAAHVISNYLALSGVACALHEGVPGRACLVATIERSAEAAVDQRPSLAFCGHTDVVPAIDNDRWTHPPFAGHLDDDGFLWGRGAVDMKGQVAARVVAFAHIARSGWALGGDLRLICQADEERGDAGTGMEWLTTNHPEYRVDYSIDEGGGERLALADGRVLSPLALGEKACLAARITAKGIAGHASMPTVGANAVPLLATLIVRLAAHRCSLDISPQMAVALDVLAQVHGNDKPTVSGIPVDAAAEQAVRDRVARCVALAPQLEHELPALISLTIAATGLVGSDTRNVMPADASVELDCRLLPGQTPDDLERELRAAMGDDIDYIIELLAEQPDGGSVSPLDSPVVDACRAFLATRQPDSDLLPALSTGFTDSHHLRSVWGTHAYGFAPVRHTPLDLYMGGVHGIDERIHVEDLVELVDFHLFLAHHVLIFDALSG